MRPNKYILLSLIALLAASLACSLDELPAPIQQSAPAVLPSETPQIIQASPTLPAPTATPTALPSETPIPAPAAEAESVRASQPLPELVEIAMFDASNGWGRSEEDIYRTGDGGQTWQAIEIPLAGPGTYFSASYLDPQTIYVIVTNPETPPSQLNISRDGGKSWQQTILGSDSPYFSAKILPVSPETLFMFQNLGAAAGSQGVGILQSLDGGQTWQQTFAHVPGEVGQASLPFGGQKSLPAFLDANLGFIGGSRPMENDIYFYRTEDAGRNWQPQPLPVPAQTSGYMAMTESPIVFPGNSEHILAPVRFSLPEGSQFIFFASADRGQTWQATAPLTKADAYQFIDLQTGWVWADGMLYTTRDSGQTWLVLDHNIPGEISLRQINFIDPQNGWALAFDLDFHAILYFTSNGGQTWDKVSP